MMKKLSFLLTIGFLSGCSLLSEDEPLPIYTLKSGQIECAQTLKDALAIDLPISEASLDTERIAITPAPYERDYLANGQWPERLPKIVQEVLVESFSERWGGGHVSRADAGLQMDYFLQTEIQDFSVYYLGSVTPEIHLKITFKLVNMRARKVFAGKIFCLKEKICSTSMKGIVAAFNKGLHGLLQQSMPWIEEEILKESALNARNNKLGRESR